MKKIAIILLFVLFLAVGCRKETKSCGLYIYTCNNGVITEEDTCADNTVNYGSCDQCSFENVLLSSSIDFYDHVPIDIVKNHICDDETCNTFEYTCNDNAIELNACGVFDEVVSCCCDSGLREVKSSMMSLDYVKQNYCENAPLYEYYCDGNDINKKECLSDKGKFADCFASCSGTHDSETSLSSREINNILCKGEPCTDSDNDDTSVKGTVVDKYEGRFTDYCVSDYQAGDYLAEFVCKEGHVGAILYNYTLDQVCRDGAFVKNTKDFVCRDDDGKNIEEMGKITITRSGIYNSTSIVEVDTCVGNEVWEYYCKGQNDKFSTGSEINETFGYQKIPCPDRFTCAGGECIEQKACRNESDCKPSPCLGLESECYKGKCEYYGACKDCEQNSDCEDNNKETVDECLKGKCRNKPPFEDVCGALCISMIIIIPSAIAGLGMLLILLGRGKR